jgi:cytidylate kinase
VSCAVVCISRAAGAGGEEIGRLVAEQLGFLYVDEEIVAGAAARGGIDPAEVADQERRKPVVTRLLEAMAQGSGEAWALRGSGVETRASLDLGAEDVRALIRETIEQTASRGNVVIVAHAASYVVHPGPDALRVLVTASPETRAGRIADGAGLDVPHAARAVRDSDSDRRDYLKRFYEVAEELPTHYDLVVNTDVLSPGRAAQVICAAASS